jgi:hypothetical protein
MAGPRSAGTIRISSRSALPFFATAPCSRAGSISVPRIFVELCAGSLSRGEYVSEGLDRTATRSAVTLAN